MSLWCQKTIAIQTEQQLLAEFNERFQNGPIKQVGVVVRVGGKDRNVLVWSGKYYRYYRVNQRTKAEIKIDGVLQTQMRLGAQRYRELPSNMR